MDPLVPTVPDDGRGAGLHSPAVTTASMASSDASSAPPLQREDSGVYVTVHNIPSGWTPRQLCGIAVAVDEYCSVMGRLDEEPVDRTLRLLCWTMDDAILAMRCFNGLRVKNQGPQPDSRGAGSSADSGSGASFVATLADGTHDHPGANGHIDAATLADWGTGTGQGPPGNGVLVSTRLPSYRTWCRS